MHRLLPRSLLTALLGSACGTPILERAPAPEIDPCLLASGGAPTTPAADFTLALDAPFDPVHAPIPVTHAEAFVFRQLYETLVVVDCQGDVRPGLARSWTPAGDGRVWEFELRDARFWDGDPVTAADVATAWAATPHAARAGVAPESVTVLSGRRLRVATDRPAPRPYLFADPAFAVAARAPGDRWPVGSGPFRAASLAGPDDAIRLVATDGSATLTVRTISPGGGRDALDGGVDMLVTDDPAALAYARPRAELVAIPLQWDRTYVLLSPAPMGSAVAVDSATFRDELARDAVRTDARGAQPPFWWGHLSGACLTPRAAPAESGARGNRILHLLDDATARGLAARLVALSLPGPGVRAEAVAAHELPDALRGGAERYVLAVPHRVFDGCAAARTLAFHAPWLAADPGGTAFSGALIPLVDVRRHVITQAVPPGARVDWDGVIRFAAP